MTDGHMPRNAKRFILQSVNQAIDNSAKKKKKRNFPFSEYSI